MNRAMALVLWGLGIIGLGLWHSVTWVQNEDADKGIYKLAVGIFCLLIGILVIAFNSKLRGKRKDD